MDALLQSHRYRSSPQHTPTSRPYSVLPSRSGRVTPRRPDLFRRPFIIVKLMHVLLPQTSDGSWRLYSEGRKVCDGHCDPRSGSEASDGYGRQAVELRHCRSRPVACDNGHWSLKRLSLVSYTLDGGVSASCFWPCSY